jgi:4-oxalocrotonate tautomerase
VPHPRRHLAEVGSNNHSIKIENETMPHIQITLLKGRSIEVKRKIASRITAVIEEEAGTAKEGISISFVEVDRESYARGGVLIADKK